MHNLSIQTQRRCDNLLSYVVDEHVPICQIIDCTWENDIHLTSLRTQISFVGQKTDKFIIDL